MLDLRTQLGDYFDHVTQHVEAEDVLEERLGSEVIRATRPRPAPARRRRWAPVLAGFLAVLTAGGLTVLLLREGAVPQTDTVVPPTTAAAPPTTAAAPPATTAAGTLDVENLVWTRIPHDETVFGDARIDSVTVFEGGLVAAGEDPHGAAVWTSPDAVTWTRVPTDTAPSAQGHIQEVIAGGPGLVAIVDGRTADTVWTSPDGITWTAAEQDFGGQIQAITSGGPGLAAVGDGLAYASVDGIEWTAGQCPDCSPRGRFGYLVDVTVGGPGLVALGNANDEGEGHAYVWTSPDGLVWTRTPMYQVVEVESVTAGGSGLVAVGRGPFGASVLTSPDGITWSKVPHDEATFGGMEMGNVVAVGDGLVVFGEWPWGEGQVWTSPDGIGWSRVPYDQAVFGGSSIHDAVVFDDRLVAVGGSSVWIASNPDGSEAPATTTAGSPPPSQPLIVGDPDDPWRRTEIAAPWAADIVDVTALPEGGFAVATGGDGAIFWSRNGVDWEDADPNDQISPSPWWEGTDEINRVDGAEVITALPGRIAVLGGTNTDPAVWLGDLGSGAWESIPLDTPGETGRFLEIAIAGSDSNVLVVAAYSDTATRYRTWLIDPGTGKAQHTTLPRSFSTPWERPARAAWFGDRWVLSAGDHTAVSRDGLNWTLGRDDDGLGSPTNGNISRYVTTLTAGRGGVLATGCEWADYLWYSEDGLEWTRATADILPLSSGAGGTAYSDTLGFVVVAGERVFTSQDARTWTWHLGPGMGPGAEDVYDVAASGNDVLVLSNTPYVLTSE